MIKIILGIIMKLRQTILIPLIVIIICLASAFLFFEKNHLETEAERTLQKDAHSLSRLIQFQIETDEKIMRTALLSIVQDRDIAKALISNNRAQLEKQSTSLFNALKTQYQITHFYYHSSDFKNIVRLHNLPHSGDIINRKSLRKAAQFKNVTVGLEQGPTGASVLRVVAPIIRFSKIIGYVELGKEFQDIVDNVASILGVDTILLADKNSINRSAWESRNNLQSFSTSWDFLNEKVIMASSLSGIPEELKKIDFKKAEKNNYLKNIYEIENENFHYKIVLLLIEDSSGINVGELLLFHDVKHIDDELKSTLKILSFTVFIIILLLLTFFYRFLGKVERILSTQQVQLIENSKMATLGEMAAGMSHEINNPLTVIQVLILSILKNIKSNTPDMERIEERLHKIQEKSERIALIIKALRDFTGENPDTISISRHKIKEAIDAALTLCRERFKQSHVTVQTESLDENAFFEGNLIDIVKVVYNILENAFDALSNYEGEKIITISAINTDDGLMIRIKNSGPKIKDSIQDKIFEPFFTTKEVGQGTGLGLSTSLGILKKYNGTIEIDKNCDQTCFLVKIPKVQLSNFSGIYS